MPGADGWRSSASTGTGPASPPSSRRRRRGTSLRGGPTGSELPDEPVPGSVVTTGLGYDVAAVDEQQRPPLPTDLDELLETLRSRVRDRRAAGDYPPGLEVNLEAHFQRIVGTRAGSDRSQFQAKLDRLAAFSSFNADRIQMWSRIPGGSAVHRGVGKVTGRQTQGILDQIQQFANALREVLDEVVDTASEAEHSHPDLVGMIDVIVDR